MSSNEELVKNVIESVAESLALEASDITKDSLLVTELDADSLDIMDIMFLLEERFDIKLEKEDFNFLKKINMDITEAVVDSKLTRPALEKLQKWLPALKLDLEISPADLGQHLTVESLVIIVQEYKKA